MQDRKVLVAETDTLVRHGIISALNRLAHVQAIEYEDSASGHAFVPADIDAAVLGPHAGHRPANDQIERIRGQRPDVPIILLQAGPAPAPHAGVVTIQIGARTLEALTGHIARLLDRGCDVTPRNNPRITARQSDVLQLMGQGYMNKQIARELSLSENTIRWHVQALLETLQASNRTQAVVHARQVGLLA